MIADARHLPLNNQSVSCIITSPPYWSLRKYDIPDLIWDEKEGCEHKWIESETPKNVGRDNGFYGGKTGFGEMDNKRKHTEKSQFCLKCGAWYGQLGLEPTIELYLKHLMQIMDECWRVLRDDGTMWVNLGDSYGGSGGAHKPEHANPGLSKSAERGGVPHTASYQNQIPAKSLCAIPERFVIDMTEKGWIRRNTIIWHKLNCMPSSAKDRFTIDFEYIFFFTKSRKYWFEQQYEELKIKNVKGIKFGGNKAKGYGNPTYSGNEYDSDSRPQGRNRRCVWAIPTQPYPESHFATFPEALIEPMIRAGCPEEICVKCGKPRKKIVETENPNRTRKISMGQDTKIGTKGRAGGVIIREIGLTDCGCNAGFGPGIVLDPFCGTGTVQVVASRLNRIGIGYDLGYEDLQEKRLREI